MFFTHNLSKYQKIPLPKKLPFSKIGRWFSKMDIFKNVQNEE